MIIHDWDNKEGEILVEAKLGAVQGRRGEPVVLRARDGLQRQRRRHVQLRHPVRRRRQGRGPARALREHQRRALRRQAVSERRDGERPPHPGVGLWKHALMRASCVWRVERGWGRAGVCCRRWHDTPVHLTWVGLGQPSSANWILFLNLDIYLNFTLDIIFRRAMLLPARGIVYIECEVYRSVGVTEPSAAAATGYMGHPGVNSIPGTNW